MQNEFPNVKGFSARNLWNMKKWYLFYTLYDDVGEALFYVRKTIEEGWSRNALDNCIRAGFYHTSGYAVTNFSDKLPVLQGRLAQELLKGNYDLGFVTLPEEYGEEALETAIEQRMTRFLLELGGRLGICRKAERNHRFRENQKD